MAPYLVPQECGNKVGVRYAKVTDARGRGLLFMGGFTADTAASGTAHCEPMNFSALPYTPHEIEYASHHYELPPVHHTVVRAAKAQMGIAGDDTWGAKTHPEHLIQEEKRMTFRFAFKGI